MSPTVAETMMESMIQLAKDKAASGNNDEAIKFLTVSIGSIESNNANVKNTYGKTLVLLYCMRAKLFFETYVPSKEDAKLNLARNDVKMAKDAVEKYGTGLDSAKMESLRGNIENLLNPDKEIREKSLEVVTQSNITSLAPTDNSLQSKTKKTSRSSSGEYGKTHFIVCPHCQVSLGNHQTTFGPSSVECFNCGKSLQTGLTPWADFSFFEKAWISLGEFVAPTFYYNNRTQACLDTFVPLFFLNPFINIGKLVWEINESNAFSKSGKPPIWKK